MKKLKLITAFIFIFASSNLIPAANPMPGGNPDTLASRMVGNLKKDIPLTDAQKVSLTKNAKAYILVIQSDNQTATGTDKQKAMIQAARAYKAAMDSILTPEQKTQLSEKQKKRSQAVMNALKDK